MKRLCALMATIAAGAGLVGCGGGGSSSASSSSAPPSSQAATSTTNAAGSSTSSNTAPNTAGLSSATLAQAVLLCKQAIDREQGVPASLKAKLNNICDQAGSGNKIAVKQATHDVCVQIVKARVPTAEQQAAEAACPAP
jgi:ABC-type phosphate transport system substrate-binding protein